MTLPAASAWIRLPVSESPVSEIRSTSSCAAIAAPTTSPAPGDDVEHARGQTGLERASSASRIVVSGVALAGLRTTELPAASAGPIFQIAIQNG